MVTKKGYVVPIVGHLSIFLVILLLSSRAFAADEGTASASRSSDPSWAVFDALQSEVAKINLCLDGIIYGRVDLDDERDYLEARRWPDLLRVMSTECKYRLVVICAHDIGMYEIIDQEIRLQHMSLEDFADNWGLHNAAKMLFGSESEKSASLVGARFVYSNKFKLEWLPYWPIYRSIDTTSNQELHELLRGIDSERFSAESIEAVWIYLSTDL